MEKLELTDARKEQAAAIDKEFAPKMAEIEKSRQALLTDEQKTAEKGARKAAKDAGALRQISTFQGLDSLDSVRTPKAVSATSQSGFCC